MPYNFKKITDGKYFCPSLLSRQIQENPEIWNDIFIKKISPCCVRNTPVEIGRQD